MIIGNLQNRDCRHLRPVQAAIEFFGTRFMIRLENQTSQSPQTDGEFSTAIAGQFVIIAGKKTLFFQIGGIRQLIEPCGEDVCPDLSEFLFGSLGIGANLLDPAVGVGNFHFDILSFRRRSTRGNFFTRGCKFAKNRHSYSMITQALSRDPLSRSAFFCKMSVKLGGRDIFDNHETSLQSVPSERLRIVIMATGAFAVPSMRVLCESDQFEIVCLVTSPLRNEKKNGAVTPARMVANEYGILVSEHENVNSTECFEFLYLVRPDLLFVCDFGQILSKRTLTGSIVGGINLHGSLLPRFRGAAPVHWAILTGETFTGVSIIRMTPQVDAGPVIAQSPPIPIGPRETVIELEERLAEYGAELVLNVAARMARGETVRIIKQLHDRASKAPRLKKEDGLVPWDCSSQDIFNHCRAMIPWPRTFTDWYRDDGTTLRLILGAVTPLDDSLLECVYEDFSLATFVAPVLTDAKWDNLAELKAIPKEKKKAPPSSSRRPPWWKPGVVIRAEGTELIVAAKEGAVRIEQIQPASKKMMRIPDFLRGYPIKQGDKLG